MSNSFGPQVLQHVRLPCPSLSPRVFSKSCPLSRWWSISSSVAPFSCPPVFPSIRVFSSQSVLWIMWPKYWSFSIHPYNEYPGVIFFRIDWVDLLAVQGTLHESSTALPCESMSSSGLSHLYGPTLTSARDYWKTIALSRQTFVGKVMSLLCNTVFRFVIAFLSRSKCLLISWLQSPSTVIMEPRK